MLRYSFWASFLTSFLATSEQPNHQWTLLVLEKCMDTNGAQFELHLVLPSQLFIPSTFRDTVFGWLCLMLNFSLPGLAFGFDPVDTNHCPSLLNRDPEDNLTDDQWWHISTQESSLPQFESSTFAGLDSRKLPANLSNSCLGFPSSSFSNLPAVMETPMGTDAVSIPAPEGLTYPSPTEILADLQHTASSSPNRLTPTVGILIGVTYQPESRSLASFDSDSTPRESSMPALSTSWTPTPSAISFERRLGLSLCTQCHKSFTRKSDLIRHDRTIHNPRNSFWCPIPGCKRNENYPGIGKPFAREDKLKAHKKVHKRLSQGA